jgi:hypothetical protein
VRDVCPGQGGCSGGEIDGYGPDYEAAAAVSNGSPKGAHFTLNMIGVSNPKDISTGGGSVIFVPLNGRAQANLSEGSFAVIDKNCTDGSCQFQLPNPDPDGDGVTSYSVFARALGKPGGSSTSTTCATDVASGELFCSVFASVQTRTKGKQTFTNVSRELLFVFADVGGDGTLERFGLFDDRLENFFWQYDNNGLKLLQYRFFEIPTNVN